LETARDAHSVCFADFMAEREADLKGRRQIGALDEIEADFENVRTAWNWAVQRSAEANLGKMLESLNVFATMRSQSLARQELIREAADRFAPAAGAQGSLLWARLIRPVDFSEYMQAGAQATANAELGLQIAQKAGDKLELARSFAALGRIHYWASDFKAAIGLYEQSQALASNLNDSLLIASNLFGLAECYSLLGQHEKAVELYRHSADVARKAGNRHWLIRVLYNTSGESNMAARYDEILPDIEEGLAIAREIRDRSGIAFGLGNLAGTLITFSSDLERAKEVARQALTMAEEVHDPISIALANSLLGYAAIREGEFVESRRKVEQAEVILENIPAIHFYLLCGLAQLDWLENNMADYQKRFRRLGEIAQGYGSPMHKLFTVAVAALRAEKVGNKERAAELALLVMNHPLSPPGLFSHFFPLFQLKGGLETQLGPEGWATALERGKRLDMDTVFAEEVSSPES
ncbi:MAG TPA: tetratricopeptide repeat protein, partial [Aggregatilineales bacterium]|nr:tetratricopeptide repeat protein [Aggregatilineales bacterium]